MRITTHGMFAFSLLGLMVLAASAQVDGNTVGSRILILQSEDMQRELKLTRTQIDKVKVIAEKEKNAFKDLPKDMFERDRKIRQIIQESQAREKQAQDLMTPEQKKRLDQILLQHDGASGLLSPRASYVLRPTEEQQRKLQDMVKESSAEIRALRKSGMKPEEIQTKLAEHQTKTLEKMVGVLTGEQKKKWKEMLGEPFKGKLVPNPKKDK